MFAETSLTRRPPGPAAFSASLAAARRCMVARRRAAGFSIHDGSGLRRGLDESEYPSAARGDTGDGGPGLGRHDHARPDHREPGRRDEHDHHRVVDGHRRRQHRRLRRQLGCLALQQHRSPGGQLRDRRRGHLPHRDAERSVAGHALLLPAEGRRRHRAEYRIVRSVLHDAEGSNGHDGPVLHDHRRLGPGQRPRAVRLQPPGCGGPADDRHGRRQRLPERRPVRLGQQRARLLREPHEARDLLPDARQSRPEQRRRVQLGKLGRDQDVRPAPQRHRAGALLLLRRRRRALHRARRQRAHQRHPTCLARQRPGNHHPQVEVRLPAPDAVLVRQRDRVDRQRLERACPVGTALRVLRRRHRLRRARPHL